MPLIKFFEHPFQNTEPEMVEASLPEWLIERFGPNPIVSLYRYSRGEPSIDTEITGDLDEIVYGHGLLHRAAVTRCIHSGDWSDKPYSGCQRINGRSCFLLTRKRRVMSAKRETPQPALPNNELAERTNKVRVLQRIEDILAPCIYPVVADAKLLEVHQQYSV